MRYRILTGITLSSGKRLEPGDEADVSLPKWVVEQGHAKPLTDDKPKKRKP